MTEGTEAVAGDKNVAILTLTGAPTAIAAYSVSISISGDNAEAVKLEMTEVTFEPGETVVDVKVTAMADKLDNEVDREVTIKLDMVPAEAADRTRHSPCPLRLWTTTTPPMRPDKRDAPP